MTPYLNGNGHQPANGDGFALARRREVVAFPDDRLPPYNLEVEAGVLGGLLLEPDQIPEVRELVRPEDFYRDAYGEVYRVILDLDAAGEPVDSITVAEALARAGRFDAIGGAEALAGFLGGVPHAANTAYYARIVRELAVTRAVIAQCNETLKAAYSRSYTADEILSGAALSLDAIARGVDTRQPKALGDILDAALAMVRRRRGGEMTGLLTGLDDLDAKLGGGLMAEELTVIAARPSQGKSCLAMTIATAAAIRLRIPALFVSLEMSEAMLGQRLLAAQSGVFGGKLQAAWNLSDRDLDALAYAADAIRSAPLEIDDRPGRSLADILSYARRRHAAVGLGLVVVDYLGMIRSTGGDDQGKPRHEVVGEMAGAFKTLARQLKVPVVLLSQLNRQCEGREGKRPQLADLRESGNVEEHADQVVLIHRPEYYDRAERPGEADLIIAKNRNGPTGDVRVRFNGALSRFEAFRDFIPPALADNQEPF